jgi:tetratricopeptide (TPR) repeat protein
MDLDVADANRQGDEAFRQHDFMAAIDFYTHGIVLDPQNPDLYADRSEALLAVGSLEDAVGDAQMHITHRPTNGTGYLRLAAALHALGRVGDAIGAIRVGLEADPTNDQLTLELAARQPPPERISDFLHPELFVDPGHPFVQAVSRDRKSISRYHRDPVLLRLVHTLAERALPPPPKKTGAAETRSSETDSRVRPVFTPPPDRAALRKKAVLLYKQGRWSECIEVCREIVGKFPQDIDSAARAWHLMASAQVQLGDLDVACRSLNESLFVKDNPQVARELIRLQSLSRAQRSAEYEDPAKAGKAASQAQFLFEQRKFPEALQAFREAIRRAPKEAAYFAMRALAFQEVGELDLALRDCDAALRINPRFVDAIRRKGEIHLKFGDLARARAAFSRVFEVEPGDEHAAEALQAIAEQIAAQRAAAQEEGAPQNDAGAALEADRVGLPQGEDQQGEFDPETAGKSWVS